MLPSADTDREVHRHAEALRGIARDLLRDPHAADDVTQATLHKALTHRELRTGPLGGWLQRVLENFARQWRRGERRRIAREARVAPREPEPCPAEALMRRESLRAVTNAVLGLDEPYQTAVFLRYFEDLPPRAIARQTGTNLATVKSRLQRGLAMLRQRLDRQRERAGDDWRKNLAATFGLPLALGDGLALTTGAWIMGSTTKVLFAAGVVCVGGIFALGFFDDPAPARGAGPATAGDTDTTTASTTAANETRLPERESATETAPVEPWLAHPFVFELEVLVVDPTGLPVEGQTPNLGPLRVDGNDAAVSTGPDGRALLTWRSRQPTGEVVVKGHDGLLHRISLQHGRCALLALAGVTSNSGIYVVAGSRLEVTTSTLSEVPTLGALPLVSRFFANAEATAGQIGMHAGLHPHAVFATDAAVVPAVAPPATNEVVLQEGLHLLGSRVRLARSVEWSTSVSEMTLTGVDADQPTAAAGIAGTVFGEDGKPAAKVPVVLLGSSPQPLQRTATGDDGHFAFDNLVEGSFTVRAGGEAGGLASTAAVVTQGVTTVQFGLHRGTTLHGRVVRSDGKPAAPYRIGWRAEDGSWCDETTTADDNTFVFANLPAVPGNVFVWTNDTGTLPVVFATHVLPDTGELLLRHDVEAGHRLLLEPLLPDACKDAPIEVRVWQLDSGLGAIVQRPEGDKPWCLERLPAGWYQVEVRAAGAGFVDLGRHWLDGKADCDLGRVALPVPGQVRFAIPDAALPENAEHHAFEICELRPDLDVRIAIAGIPRDRPMHLPAGDYVFAFRHRDGGVRFVRFAVRGGTETLVSVPQ